MRELVVIPRKSSNTKSSLFPDPASKTSRQSKHEYSGQKDCIKVVPPQSPRARKEARGHLASPKYPASSYKLSRDEATLEGAKNNKTDIRTPDHIATIAQKTPSFNRAKGGLATADQLQIKVIGHRGLSGAYIVSANQTISFPSIGHLNIANKSLSDLEQILAEKVSEMTGSRSYVTVEILKYRPILQLAIS